MIKSFEQFILEKYNNPINEAFQSSKLREIIKQHGKPKYNFENKMLYDLQDDEIVDVLGSRKEYWEKYSDARLENKQATFIIEMEDGAVVVISNLGILQNHWYPKDIERQKEEEFKKRHSERHKGNLGKGGDEIHKKHMEKVDKIERRRLAEKLQPNIQEIVDAIKYTMNDVNPSEFVDEDTVCVESEMTLNGEEYEISAIYEGGCYDEDKEYGVVNYYVSYNLVSFELYNEETNVLITNEELGVTEATHKELFKEEKKEVEGEIYDYYDYFGVSPSDFV
jgi:hypothetical protein